MDRYQKLLNEKAKNKRAVLGTMFFPRNPVVFVDLSDQQTFNEKAQILEALDALHITTLALVPASFKKEAHFVDIHLIATDEKEKKLSALNAADLAITFNGSIKEFRSNGCVPVAPQNGSDTINFDPLQEKGNGFYFKSGTVWEAFAAVVRALETYRFPYDWENVVKAGFKKS